MFSKENSKLHFDRINIFAFLKENSIYIPVRLNLDLFPKIVRHNKPIEDGKHSMSVLYAVASKLSAKISCVPLSMATQTR